MEEKTSFKDFLASTLGRIIVTIISAIIVYGILFWCLASSSDIVLGITLLVCCVFGWRALNRITPNIFLFGTMNFWLIYFLIKGLLAIIVGAFVAPFQIGKMISNAASDVAINS